MSLLSLDWSVSAVALLFVLRVAADPASLRNVTIIRSRARHTIEPNVPRIGGPTGGRCGAADGRVFLVRVM